VGLSLAFDGAFFAWPCQAGVAAFAQDRGLLDAASRIYGTSSGAGVGVGPRIPRTKPDHITPSEAIGFEQRFSVLPIERRRELFHLGYADARGYLKAA
jgi:hypothetical protein